MISLLDHARVGGPVLRRFRNSIVPASIVLACATGAGAREPAAELPAGGLTYAALQVLVTEKEDIVVAPDRVNVTYIVRNTAAEPRSALMAFLLPDIDMIVLDGARVHNPAFDWQNVTNYVGFTALIDGQPAETYVESRALAIGLIDVSAKLEALHLPFYPLHPDMGALIAALPEAARAELVGLGLVKLEEGEWLPLWRLKTVLFWQQPFAARQTLTVGIAYRPISGSADWSAESAPILQERYCVPQGVADELARRSSTGNGPATVKWVHYLASAGASARGPSTNYRTAIATAGTSQTAYSCHERLKTAVPAGARDAVAVNVAPEEDVLVLFVD